jgi:hypothetical protein
MPANSISSSQTLESSGADGSGGRLEGVGGPRNLLALARGHCPFQVIHAPGSMFREKVEHRVDRVFGTDITHAAPEFCRVERRGASVGENQIGRTTASP